MLPFIPFAALQALFGKISEKLQLYLKTKGDEPTKNRTSYLYRVRILCSLSTYIICAPRKHQIASPAGFRHLSLRWPLLISFLQIFCEASWLKTKTIFQEILNDGRVNFMLALNQGIMVI